MPNKINEAKSFITIQLKTTTNPKPVLKHSLTVGKILEEHKYSNDIVIAGYLHDILEDSNTKKETIQKQFGKTILKLVALNTFDESIENKIKSYKELFKRCSTSKPALIVKTADLLANSPYCLFTAKDELNTWWIEKLEYFLDISKSKLSDELIYKTLFKKHKEVIKQNKL